MIEPTETEIIAEKFLAAGFDPASAMALANHEIQNRSKPGGALHPTAFIEQPVQVTHDGGSTHVVLGQQVERREDRRPFDDETGPVIEPDAEAPHAPEAGQRLTLDLRAGTRRVERFDGAPRRPHDPTLMRQPDDLVPVRWEPIQTGSDDPPPPEVDDDSAEESDAPAEVETVEVDGVLEVEADAASDDGTEAA